MQVPIPFITFLGGKTITMAKFRQFAIVYTDLTVTLRG